MKAIQIENLKPWFAKSKDFLERPWVQILLPILFIFPSTLAVTYYSIENFRAAVDNFLPESAPVFLANNIIPITIGALILSYFVSNIHLILSKFVDNHAPSSEVLIALNEGFNALVDAKTKRFDSEYKKYEAAGSISSEEIFAQITKPDQQIILLTELIHLFFVTTNPKIKFKVRVVDIEKNKVKDWFYYAPKNCQPRTPISILKKPDSSISACLKKKSMLIIEDIVKESSKPKGRRYVMSHGDDEETGSLLCFPVFHEPTRCYPYVITVSTNIAFFRNTRKDFYNWLFNQFARRIQLEHTLLLLKETTQHVDNAKQ